MTNALPDLLYASETLVPAAFIAAMNTQYGEGQHTSACRIIAAIRKTNIFAGFHRSFRMQLGFERFSIYIFVPNQ